MRKSLSKNELEYYTEKIKFLKRGFDVISDHVVITDRDANILYANKGAERATGFLVSEMIGKNPADLWGGNMSKEFYKEMWHKIKDLKQPFVGEVRNKRKDGTECWQNLHISAVLDTNGEVEFFIGIEPDISERKIRERFREEFISVVSHQLRNPLTAINWTLDWISKRGKLTKGQKDTLREVYKHSMALVDLVKDLVTLSRIEGDGAKKESIDLVSEIKDIVAGVKDKFSKTSISFNAGIGKTIQINVDKHLVSQLFTNLILNAAEYSNRDSGKVEITLSQDRSNYICTLKDNGIGIPDKDKSSIFSRFFRASNANEAKGNGVGLGLFVVKMIADYLGWKISFESEVGKGTTFFVKIPIKKAPDR